MLKKNTRRQKKDQKNKGKMKKRKKQYVINTQARLTSKITMMALLVILLTKNDREQHQQKLKAKNIFHLSLVLVQKLKLRQEWLIQKKDKKWECKFYLRNQRKQRQYHRELAPQNRTKFLQFDLILKLKVKGQVHLMTAQLNQSKEINNSMFYLKMNSRSLNHRISTRNHMKRMLVIVLTKILAIAACILQLRVYPSTFSSSC